MIYKPLDPDYERKVRDSFARQPFMDFIGAKLTKIMPGYCEIELDYREELTQQHGFFHAGIVGTIADNSCGYAAYSLMPVDSSVLTVEYKLNLISPAKGSSIISRGEVIKSGRTITVAKAEVVVVAENQKNTCASALITLMTLAGKADRPEGK